MRALSLPNASSEITNQWLGRAEPIHRQLRPRLPADYAAKMQRVFAGGARLLLALDDQAAGVLGLAVWRAYEDTANGLKLYVDDLVTDEEQRSRGVGRALIGWIDEEARRIGADAVILDSGTQRTRAHRFYLREGFEIRGFTFYRRPPP